MRIDWFTFAAQIFNFVLLVYLLKRFLYGPVIEAVDRRESRIQEQLEEARSKEERVEEERRDLEVRREELESRRDGMLEEAREEAEAEKRELQAQVRDEVEKSREEWREALRRQEDSFLEELRRRIGSETCTLVRRVVAELADAELEERVIRVFLSRLRETDEGDRRAFLDALEDSGGEIRMRSAFGISEEHRATVREAVGEWTRSDPDIRFDEDPDLALGIEMRAGDRKVAWSVGSYLEALESELARYLESELG